MEYGSTPNVGMTRNKLAAALNVLGRGGGGVDCCGCIATACSYIDDSYTVHDV